jgi:hypothetical protein
MAGQDDASRATIRAKTLSTYRAQGLEPTTLPMANCCSDDESPAEYRERIRRQNRSQREIERDAEAERERQRRDRAAEEYQRNLPPCDCHRTRCVKSETGTPPCGMRCRGRG